MASSVARRPRHLEDHEPVPCTWAAAAACDRHVDSVRENVRSSPRPSRSLPELGLARASQRASEGHACAPAGSRTARSAVDLLAAAMLREHGFGRESDDDAAVLEAAGVHVDIGEAEGGGGPGGDALEAASGRALEGGSAVATAAGDGDGSSGWRRQAFEAPPDAELEPPPPTPPPPPPPPLPPPLPPIAIPPVASKDSTARRYMLAGAAGLGALSSVALQQLLSGKLLLVSKSVNAAAVGPEPEPLNCRPLPPAPPPARPPLRLRTSLSVRTTLLLSYLVFVGGGIAMTWGISYLFAARNVDELADRLMASTVLRIQSLIQETLLRPALDAARSASVNYSFGWGTEADARQLLRRWYYEMTSHPYIYTIYLGLDRFFGVRRDSPGNDGLYYLTPGGEAGTVREYRRVDPATLEPADVFSRQEGYVTTRRDWFQQIARGAAGEFVWTNVYPSSAFATTGNRFVTVGTPLYGYARNASRADAALPAGLHGVLAVDLEVRSISAFLQMVAAELLTPRAVAFVAEDDGTMVGISSAGCGGAGWPECSDDSAADERALLTGPNGEPIRAAESANEVVRACWQAAEMDSLLSTSQDSTQAFSVVANGRKYFVSIANIRYEPSLVWHLLAAIPEDDMLSNVRHLNVVSGAINAVFLASSLAFSLLITLYITRPLLRLQETMELITRSMGRSAWEGKAGAEQLAEEGEDGRETSRWGADREPDRSSEPGGSVRPDAVAGGTPAAAWHPPEPAVLPSPPDPPSEPRGEEDEADGQPDLVTALAVWPGPAPARPTLEEAAGVRLISWVPRQPAPAPASPGISPSRARRFDAPRAGSTPTATSAASVTVTAPRRASSERAQRERPDPARTRRRTGGARSLGGGEGAGDAATPGPDHEEHSALLELPRSRIAEIQVLQSTFQTLSKSVLSFMKFVPTGVVRNLIASNDQARLGMEIRQLTVMFVDIEDFTRIAERISLEQLVVLVTEYFEATSTVMEEYGATIDKYIGDALMLLWNAPVLMPDHEVQACAAALACKRRLGQLRQHFRSIGLPPLRSRFGIHSGDCLVGNLGSKFRMNYTAMGDAVNLASRCESLNKVYGSTILITGEVHEKVRGRFLCRWLDRATVKGKSRPTDLYELVCAAGEPCPAGRLLMFEQYGAALSALLAGRSAEAADGFADVLRRFPRDKPARLMLERARRYARDPGLFREAFEWDRK